MKLLIKNVGKVEKIDIDINGITVLIGVNETGKSTVNRSLYSILNSFCNTSYKIMEKKQRNITRKVDKVVEKIISSTNETELSRFNIRSRSIGYSRRITRKIIQQYQQESIEEKFSKNQVEEIIKETFDLETINEEMEEYINSIVQELNKQDIEYMDEIINTQFLTEFNEQINNIDTKEIAEISLEEENTKVYAKFENNRVIDFSKLKAVRYNPIYIDTPYILDFYDGYGFFTDKEEGHAEKVVGCFKKRIIDNIDNLQESTERLEKVNDILNEIVDGNFSYNEIGDITYENRATKSKLELTNLATGLKTFVIIKKLIENGVIDENTVLIIDEPEVHLHPDWQLKLAQILVNLNKELDIKILISTHSPYFLRAIQIYSAKYNIADKEKIYYISNTEKKTSISSDITNDTSEVFKQLTKPFIDLENV